MQLTCLAGRSPLPTGEGELFDDFLIASLGGELISPKPPRMLAHGNLCICRDAVSPHQNEALEVGENSICGNIIIQRGKKPHDRARNVI